MMFSTTFNEVGRQQYSESKIFILKYLKKNINLNSLNNHTFISNLYVNKNKTHYNFDSRNYFYKNKLAFISSYYFLHYSLLSDHNIKQISLQNYVKILLNMCQKQNVL